METHDWKRMREEKWGSREVGGKMDGNRSQKAEYLGQYFEFYWA